MCLLEIIYYYIGPALVETTHALPRFLATLQHCLWT